MPLEASEVSRPRRVLVLGGAAEGRKIAARIAGDARFEGIVSLAGRTAAPHGQALPTRVGGFGGAAGLARYLVEARIDAVVDATHPFAARISENARRACADMRVPLVRLARAPWRRRDGDRWTEVADNAAAAAALGAVPRRVFLTIGRQGVGDFRAAPQHDYLVRAIDAPDPGELPPCARLLLARGPFDLAGEMALMREARVDVVVSKNSGGDATFAKIETARRLGLEVVMIDRPPQSDAPQADDVEAAMAFLGAGFSPDRRAP